MPQFTWTSRDHYDVVRSGIITAPTAGKAAAALAARSVKADAVLPLPPAGNSTPGEQQDSLDLSRIKGTELLQTLREMVGLLRHGVSRQRVFTALGAATANPVLADVLQGMGQRTQSGMPLYRAMAAWPALFDPVVQALVRHGEGENRLPDCIKAVHAYLEFNQAMRLLEDQLKPVPPALRRQAQRDIAQGRLLAGLAAGQGCGLPLDLNLDLAARHCGDASIAARVLQTWDQQQATSPQAAQDSTLQRTLVAAGVVGTQAWQQAAAGAASHGGNTLAALLQSLTQASSTRATAGTDALKQKLHSGMKGALRAAIVVLVLLVGLYALR
jgi:Type II secretion system (T2SS), protein F